MVGDITKLQQDAEKATQDAETNEQKEEEKPGTSVWCLSVRPSVCPTILHNSQFIYLPCFSLNILTSLPNSSILCSDDCLWTHIYHDFSVTSLSWCKWSNLFSLAHIVPAKTYQSNGSLSRPFMSLIFLS